LDEQRDRDYQSTGPHNTGHAPDGYFYEPSDYGGGDFLGGSGAGGSWPLPSSRTRGGSGGGGSWNPLPSGYTIGRDGEIVPTPAEELARQSAQVDTAVLTERGKIALTGMALGAAGVEAIVRAARAAAYAIPLQPHPRHGEL
jgi:hypothetical protein